MMSYLKSRYLSSMLFIQPVHVFDRPYAPQAIPGKQRYAESFITEVEKLCLRLEDMKGTSEWESFLSPLSLQYLAMFKRFFDWREKFIKPCFSGKFLFVNSTGMVRGCLFSDIIAGIRSPAGIVTAARQEFSGWQRGCGLCIHGCS